MKLFYIGPAINAETLVMMLEKHGIAAVQEFAQDDQHEEDELNRLSRVLVPEEEYDRAHQLFYSERQDEL